MPAVLIPVSPLATGEYIAAQSFFPIVLKIKCGEIFQKSE